MAVEFTKKSSYDINDLLGIVKILRGKDGCPWDIVQTHESIRLNFVEETYEVVDAIANSNTDELKEELGDVLLQVALHSSMEEENGTFDFSDVADGICKKLILRHPHVFGEVVADTADEVLINWDIIKKQEKNQKSSTDTLLSVPKSFPALMRAAKVQKRAGKAGFDYPDVTLAFDSIESELTELKEALKEGSTQHCTEELGDLLFSVVNVSRFIGVDSEESLNTSTEKFIMRFSIVEKLAGERGVDMKTATIDELDLLWDDAKSLLNTLNGGN